MIRNWDSRKEKKDRCHECHKTTVTAGDAAEKNKKVFLACFYGELEEHIRYKK